MKKLCLIIIDGLGVAPPGPGNARTLAQMPTMRKLEETVPNCLMAAAGNAVGLPEGQQGASEPGHLIIGAGRIVWQPLEEINRAISSGEFFRNEVLIGACERARNNGTLLHLLGIYSSGNVHGSIEHYHALLTLAQEIGVSRVMLHLIGDGRDTPEQQFCIEFDLLRSEVEKQHLGTIASLIGRYFAMDRDRQYAERTKVAYDLLTQGVGEIIDDLGEGARAWYLKAPEKEKTDYYIRPLKTRSFEPMKEGDTVICTNFRSDRMIQLVRALEDPDFAEFARPIRVQDLVCMGPYSDRLPVAYPATEVRNTLGEVVSKAGGTQLRIGETDKYAHVTFFFNAQRHAPFEGQEDILIESPKVPNYADAPDMSADALTDELIKQVKSGKKDLIVANFANPDLVGHGGKLDAAIKACEAVDRNLTRLLPVLESERYDWIITADHGNAEEMYYPGTDVVCPSHTKNRVQTFVHSPLITSSDQLKSLIGLRQGSPLRPVGSEGQAGRQAGLKDIAPLSLRIMGIPVPAEMK